MKNHLLLANSALGANATVASPLNQNAQGLFDFNKMALFDYDLDDMIEYAALNSLFANNNAANAGVANPLFDNQLFANNGANIFSQISALYNADFSQLQTNSAQSPLNQNAQGLFGFNKMALFDYDLDDMIEYAALNSLFANNNAANAGVANNQPFGNSLFANNGANIFSQMPTLYNADFLQANGAQTTLNQNAQGLFGFNKMALFDYDLDDMIENAALSSLFANNANTQLFSTNALNNAFMMEAYEDFYDDMKDYYKIDLLNKQAAQGGMQGLFFIDD